MRRPGKAAQACRSRKHPAWGQGSRFIEGPPLGVPNRHQSKVPTRGNSAKDLVLTRPGIGVGNEFFIDGVILSEPQP
jgi:hypothetical protein